MFFYRTLFNSTQYANVNVMMSKIFAKVLSWVRIQIWKYECQRISNTAKNLKKSSMPIFYTFDGTITSYLVVVN